MARHTTLLLRLVDCLESLGIAYFITGSCASMMYGETRLTNDIDAVVELSSRGAHGLIALFPPPDYYVSEEAAQYAIARDGMFNIVEVNSGLKIDLIMRKDKPFDDVCFHRSRRLKVDESRTVVFSAPEEIILNKLLFYREGGSEKHLRDIAGMFKFSAAEIDVSHLEHWALRIGVKTEWDAVKRRLGI